MSNHYVIAIVLLSCFVTSLSRIFLKKGLMDSNAITGMVFSLLFGWMTLLGVFIAQFSQQTLSMKGVLFFSAIGIIAPPVVRYFTYLGVEKLGPSRSDPIRSLTPLFAVVFSFFLFEEKFNASSLWATVFIVIGAYFLSRDGRSEEKKLFNMSDLLWPLIAALLAGIVSNLRKIGMNLEISSVAAALVAASSAIVTFGLFLLYRQNYKRLILKKSSMNYLIITGVLVSVTDVIDLIALKSSKVSIVAPLLATTPLFVILLSWLFLKNIEKFTANLLLGASMISAGVGLVVMYAR